MIRASRGGRRSGVIAAAVFTALLGSGALAAPASAHVPGWSVTCDTASIDLTNYDTRATNTVELKADGKDLLPATQFGDTYHNTFQLPKHSSPLPVELVVHAGDDQRYSVDQTKTAPVCANASTSATPSGPPPVSSSPLPSVTATLSASPSAVAPVPSPSQSGGLAQTGGSSATPLIAGGAAVLAAGGALLVFGRKRRASGAHAAR